MLNSKKHKKRNLNFNSFDVAGGYSWPLGWVRQVTIVASRHEALSAAGDRCHLYTLLQDRDIAW